MAIDSANDRFSLVGLGSPLPRLLSVPADGVTASDRRTLIYGFPPYVLSGGEVTGVQKRWSLIALAFPAGRVIPPPDGTFENPKDRRHLEFLYANDFAPAPPPPPDILTGLVKRKKRKPRDYSQSNVVIMTTMINRCPF